jgi:drug/metabolite transporter (DMT)-like permease
MHHHRPRDGAENTVGIHGFEALQPVPSEAPARSGELAGSVDSAAHSPAHLGWLIFWMSGTLAAFIVAALSVRALSHSLNAFEMMTIRSFGGLVILLAMGLASPALLRSIKWRHMRLQLCRNVAHFGSQICWTIGIAVLPFATVFALEFIIPAWVTLLAVLFLGERMTATRAGALAICFVGVLVILRPGHDAFQPVALLMVLGALLFAIAAVITKKLIVTESTFSIMLWMNLMQLPMNYLGSDKLFFLKLDAAMALPLLGVAVAGLAIHYCLTNAFRHGDAMVVIPMDFLRVPLIAVIGWMFYGEHLDIFVFAGAGLIIAGVLWNVRGEARRNGRLSRALPSRRPAIQPAE